jgi:hypothetical protein
MEEGQIHQTSMDDERQEKLVWKRDFPPLLQGFYFQLLAGLNDANLGTPSACKRAVSTNSLSL